MALEGRGLLNCNPTQLDEQTTLSGGIYSVVKLAIQLGDSNEVDSQGHNEPILRLVLV